MVIPEDSNCVISLTLQNQSAIFERNSAVAARAQELERLRVVESAAAASLVCWTPDKIDIVPKRDEALAAVERLNTDLIVLRKQVFGHTTVHFELCGAQYASFRFGTRWKSTYEHVKATEPHFVQVGEQHTIVQGNLAHEKSRLGEFEAS